MVYRESMDRNRLTDLLGGFPCVAPLDVIEPQGVRHL